jgi:uncharacterized protein YjiS (DUF1127 family)
MSLIISIKAIRFTDCPPGSNVAAGNGCPLEGTMSDRTFNTIASSPAPPWRPGTTGWGLVRRVVAEPAVPRSGMPDLRGASHHGEAPRAGFWAMLRSAWRRHRTRGCLADLDAHLLKDIGVSYAEAEAEANKPFWVP